MPWQAEKSCRQKCSRRLPGAGECVLQSFGWLAWLREDESLSLGVAVRPRLAPECDPRERDGGLSRGDGDTAAGQHRANGAAHDGRVIAAPPG